MAESAVVDWQTLCYDRILPCDLHTSGFSPEPTRRGPLTDPTLPVRLSSVIYVKKAWPSGKTLRVFFMENHPDRENVLRLAAEWSRYCSITFREVFSRGDSDVRVRFSSNEGSWSYIGTDSSQVPYESHTMNLGKVDQGTVLHEFGHVLGLIHEHQSPLKGGFAWDREAVTKSLRGAPNFWTDDLIEKNMFERYGVDKVEGTRYDSTSIMHYSYPKEWIKQQPGRAEPKDIPRNTVLSELDKSFIARIYGLPSASPQPGVVLPPSEPLRPPSPPKPPKVEVTDFPYDIKEGQDMTFTFKTDQGDPLEYTLETHGEVDLVMSLYGPNSRETFVTSDDDSGDKLNAKIVKKLKPNSTYSIILRAFGEKGGKFNLTISTVVTVRR